MQTLNIMGEVQNELRLPIPDELKASLVEKGVKEIPEYVTLFLRESSLGERREMTKTEALAKAQDKPEEWLLEIIMKRAVDDTDPRIIKAMIDVMPPSVITKLSYACMHGELPKE